MGYEALLFCPDEKTARTVTQVLSELEFNVEACLEPFAAVKKLMGQHFDAVVVDCDNEQNATLLFKSARNSTSNQASLAVAVVEGQAGVAKAFRIGANLVLTKPINIEQSKGTLRVARGLLRKGEPPKPGAPASAPGTATLPAAGPIPGVGATPGAGAAAAKPAAARPVAPAKSAVPAKPAAVAAPRPATIPVAKPVAIPARPAPAVAATKSIPAAPAAAAHNQAPHTPQTKNADLPQINVENSVSAQAAAAPIVPAVNRVAPPAPLAAKLPVASVPVVASVPAVAKPAYNANAITGSPVAIGGGAASAPAPAREAQDSHSTEISPESSAVVAPVVSDKPAEASHSDSGFVGGSPSFTFGGANLPEEKSGKGKKTFLGVAAVVLVVAALYYGWTQYKTATTAPILTPAPTKPFPAPTATPGSVSANSAAAHTGSAALPGSPDATTTTSPNDAGASQPAAASTGSASSAPVSTKPAGSTSPDSAKPDSSKSDSPKSDSAKPDSPKPDSLKPSPKLGSAKPGVAPLVVKGGTAPTLQSVAAAPDSPAPSMTGIATGAGAPPPDLGSGADGGLTPVLQTVTISQGVSRGLLVKKVAPIYPKTALTMRIEGPVELTTTISKNGDISHVKVLSGDPQLTRAAVDAVKQWKYKPYLLNGEPVEIQTQITVNFKLPE
jgi:protein TonB